jgi:hypothetical protein
MPYNTESIKRGYPYTTTTCPSCNIEVGITVISAYRGRILRDYEHKRISSIILDCWRCKKLFALDMSQVQMCTRWWDEFTGFTSLVVTVYPIKDGTYPVEYYEGDLVLYKGKEYPVASVHIASDSDGKVSYLIGTPYNFIRATYSELELVKREFELDSNK